MNILPLNTDLLGKLMPRAKKTNVVRFCEPLNIAMEEFEINSKLRIAAFLAQIEVESGSLQYVEEIADGSAYEYRKDLGNLEPVALAIAHGQGTTTGRLYKGYGLIQITGYFNYKECGKALGVDLETTPSLLKEPLLAARSAAWFFEEHECNELADEKSFEKISKRVNGGSNGKHERFSAYARNLHILGL